MISQLFLFLGFLTDFRFKSAQGIFFEVNEFHQFGQRWMDIPDPQIHLLGNSSVAGVALGNTSQFCHPTQGSEVDFHKHSMWYQWDIESVGL